jgi:Ice-binding-like/PEP-CTERM motif
MVSFKAKAFAIPVLAALAFAPAEAWATPLLGSAQSFAVLAAAGVSVNGSGATNINGDVGSYPTNTITGFPPGIITGGTMASDAASQAAQGDALLAYNFLAGQTPTAPTLSGTIGDLTLTPGVYDFTTTALLTGTLTLDAQGSNNAVFIFQVGTSLTTGSSAVVALINGGPDDGIFWQIGVSATLGDSTMFAGNILAGTSISLDPSARITCGRALAGINVTSGAVTMADTNGVAVNDGSSCIGGYGGGYTSTDMEGVYERVADNDGNGGGTEMPEPGTLAIFGLGLAGLLIARRRPAARF